VIELNLKRKTFCQVLISATTKNEADRIINKLLGEKLIAGALITNGPSRYFWKGKIEEKNYFNISAFSLMKNKKSIISEVEKIHTDKAPIIAFIKIDGNDKFLKWVEKEIR
jgi:uncharacterized protein involved in tolerance to divalent cations